MITNKTARMLVLKRCAIKSETSGMALTVCPYTRRQMFYRPVLHFTFMETFFSPENRHVLDIEDDLFWQCYKCTTCAQW